MRFRTCTPALDQSDCSIFITLLQDGFEFERRYKVVLNQTMGPPLNIVSKHKSAPTCYDAMWTLARALNSTIRGQYSKTKCNSESFLFCDVFFCIPPR